MSNFINDGGQIKKIIDVNCLASVVSSKHLAVLFAVSYIYQRLSIQRLIFIVFGYNTLSTRQQDISYTRVNKQ